jgi:protein SCO1
MLRPFVLSGGLFLAAATFAAGDDGGPARELEFVPPPAGSYRLEHIMPTPGGTVLDTDDQPKPLARFTTGKVTVLSFDPEHDTPEAMRLYGGSHMADKGGLPWYFLTSPSPMELRPMLEGFDQDLSVVLDENGKSTGSLSHVLKVFLIDRRGSIREIYTTSFLLPQVLLNDIRTLLIEQGIGVN